jgi:hypothetical protein
LNLNNNYLKNISILPYIRSQQLGFNVTGLLPNSPVTVTFDGVDVNSYLISPDTIELVNVSGTFSEGDVVGFYNNNQFSPTRRVTQSRSSERAFPCETNPRIRRNYGVLLRKGEDGRPLRDPRPN